MLVALLLAQGLHADGSLGVGTAYDSAGVRVQAGTQHLELFAGFGLLAVAEGSSVTADGPVGFSAGLRWYAGDRRSLFVSLNFTDSVYSIWADYDLRGPTSPRFRGSLSTLTLVVGYRWNLGGFFVEAGAGAGGYRERVPQSGTEGIGNAGKASYGPIPDGVIGVGFEL